MVGLQILFLVITLILFCILGALLIDKGVRARIDWVAGKKKAHHPNDKMVEIDLSHEIQHNSRYKEYRRLRKKIAEEGNETDRKNLEDLASLIAAESVEEAGYKLNKAKKIEKEDSPKELSRAEVYAKNLKEANIFSDYDILTKWMKYSPEEAKEMIERRKLEKLEELKLQVLAQNPSGLAARQLMAKDVLVEPPTKHPFDFDKQALKVGDDIINYRGKNYLVAKFNNYRLDEKFVEKAFERGSWIELNSSETHAHFEHMKKCGYVILPKITKCKLIPIWIEPCDKVAVYPGSSFSEVFWGPANLMFVEQENCRTVYISRTPESHLIPDSPHNQSHYNAGHFPIKWEEK